MHSAYVDRLVDLLDPAANLIWNMPTEEAVRRVGSGDPQQVRAIQGQFALLHKEGPAVRMARSIGRPMRTIQQRLFPVGTRSRFSRRRSAQPRRARRAAFDSR